jgi:hypothetical protein
MVVILDNTPYIIVLYRNNSTGCVPFSFNKTSIQELAVESSAHFGACKYLKRLQIILDRIGVLFRKGSENAQRMAENAQEQTGEPCVACVRCYGVFREHTGEP